MTETKPMMTFPEAIKSCLRQYARFSGRATRAEYWWWALGTVVVSFLLGILDGIIFGFELDNLRVFGILFPLAALLPWLAVTARRLHDIGRTGWWQLVWLGGILPPVGLVIFIVWIVWMTKRGTAGPNRFGPDPLA